MNVRLVRRGSGGLVLLCFLIIVVASFRPIDLADSVNHGDKVGHLLAYAALAFFWSLAGAQGLRRLIVIFIACSLLGSLIEVIQPSFDRFGSVADAVADLLGAGLGVLLSIVGGTVMSRRQST